MAAATLAQIDESCHEAQKENENLDTAVADVSRLLSSCLNWRSSLGQFENRLTVAFALITYYALLLDIYFGCS